MENVFQYSRVGSEIGYGNIGEATEKALGTLMTSLTQAFEKLFSASTSSAGGKDIDDDSSLNSKDVVQPVSAAAATTISVSGGGVTAKK